MELQAAFEKVKNHFLELSMYLKDIWHISSADWDGVKLFLM